MIRRKTLATAFLGLAAATLGAGMNVPGAVHAAAAGTVTQYTMVPTPIRPQASLPANTTVNVTLTAYDLTGTPVSGATVFLTETPTTLGGISKVGATQLSRVPTGFPTNSSGQVVIAYKSGTAVGGKDTILAQDNTTTPTVEATDWYIYTPITNLTLQSKPIAPSHSLSAGQHVNVTVTAFGLSGSPMASAQVYLTLISVGTAPTGQASVGSTALSKHPQLFFTNASGQIVVTYTAGSAGTTKDKLTAEDAKHSPSVSIQDSYTY
jgi:hypothetical protein